MDIKTVVVPVDFSPPSRLALNHGVALARRFRARLVLLHIMETPPALAYTYPTDYAKIEAQHREQAWRMLSALVAPEDQDVALVHAVHEPTLVYVEAGMPPIDKRQLLDDARERLKALEAEAFQRKIRIETLLLEGNPAETILKAAEENCADLIVMTVSKKGLIERALLGSTAERLIREAHLPVLSIPV
jgi:nucleotide-binding universal stress UspA family protein